MFKMKLIMNEINKIMKDHGLDENGAVTKCLRNTVDRFCDSYVPFSGNSSGMKSHKTYPNNHSIRYEEPYAHYMYKGKKAVGPSKPKGVKRTISNQPLKYQGAPRRGAEWDKRMMSDRKMDVIRDVQNFIKKGGK